MTSASFCLGSEQLLVEVSLMPQTIERPAAFDTKQRARHAELEIIPFREHGLIFQYEPQDD
jgi:hypothetical protein